MLDVLKKLYVFILVTINIFFITKFNQRYPILYLMELINILFSVLLLSRKSCTKLIKKSFIFACLYFLLFLVMLPITELFEMVIYNKLITVIYLLLSLISLLCLLYFLFSYENKNEEFQITKKFKIMLLIFPTLILMFMLFAEMPGLMDVDTIYVWNYIETWHSMGFCLFMQLFKLLFNDLFFVRIVQFLLILYAVYYSINLLYRITKNKKVLILYLILLCFNIVYFQQVLFFWKDIIFGITFYLFLLTMIDIYLTKDFKINLFIKLTVFAIIVSNVRHIAIVIPLIGFVILILFKSHKKMYLLSLLFVIIVNFFITRIVPTKILQIPLPPPYLKNAVSIQMLGTFVVDDSIELTNEEIKYLENYMPISEWKNLYNRYDSDDLAKNFEKNPIKDNLVEFSNFDIVKYNANFFFKYPIKYIIKLFDYNNILWKFNINDYTWEKFHNEVNLVQKSDGLLYYDDAYDNSFFTKKIKQFNEFLNNIGIGRLLVRNAIPAYLLLLSFGLFIYKRRYYYALTVGILLIWLMLLFISIPYPYTKYCIQFFDSYMFFFSLALFIPCKFKVKN